MEELTIFQWLTLALGSIAVLTFGSKAVMSYLKPNIKQDKELIGITKDISILQEDLKLIRINHLDHLEADVKGLREGMVRIETILEERLPKK